MWWLFFDPDEYGKIIIPGVIIGIIILIIFYLVDKKFSLENKQFPKKEIVYDTVLKSDTIIILKIKSRHDKRTTY